MLLSSPLVSLLPFGLTIDYRPSPNFFKIIGNSLKTFSCHFWRLLKLDFKNYLHKKKRSSAGAILARSQNVWKMSFSFTCMQKVFYFLSPQSPLNSSSVRFLSSKPNINKPLWSLSLFGYLDLPRINSFKIWVHFPPHSLLPACWLDLFIWNYYILLMFAWRNYQAHNLIVCRNEKSFSDTA